MAAYTTIDDPGSFFNVLAYSYASSPNAITGMGFAPDSVSIKGISGTHSGAGWYIGDTVRGNEKFSIWNSTAAEAATTDSILSFDSDGYTLGADATYNCNAVGTNYIAYNWKAGTTTGIAGSPSITPTSYSFNATSGYSLIAYTGTGVAATLPHGLGVAPDMIIVKELSSTDSWLVYHIANGNTKYLQLNEVDSASTSSEKWNDTSPTSTLFSLGTNTDVNASGSTYMAYCFAPVQGFSKFGKYTGNGGAGPPSTAGEFIYTGFRPATVLIKRTDTNNDWVLIDRLRLGYNSSSHGNYILKTNTAGVSYASDWLEIFSNGFGTEDGDAHVNASGGTYAYAAWAYQPFANSNGVPANAR